MAEIQEMPAMREPGTPSDSQNAAAFVGKLGVQAAGIPPAFSGPVPAGLPAPGPVPALPSDVPDGLKIALLDGESRAATERANMPHNVTPPGGEAVVRALKRKEDQVENPYAVAWAMKAKGQI